MTSISLVSRTGLLVASCVGLPTLLACLDHPLKPVEYEAVQEGREGIALTINKDVDILFMIDDSGSMAEEQLALANNFDAFIQVLEQPGVEANYRIGITTSDKGNPLCPTTIKQPDDGKFKLSSCRSRQSHFTFNTVPPVEAFDVACANICPYDEIEILPTSTDRDPNERPRPWVESIEGVTNIGRGRLAGTDDWVDNISTEEAFQCLGPMGIAGCGYEEQLDNVYRAILRANTEGEDQYGFIRPNAILAIVLVSDEADGSLNRSVGNIYDLDGHKRFWQDPDANFPTSTVSWKAGVQCDPVDSDGLPYDDCYAQHYDFEREVIPEERAGDEAVLYPVSRYINQVQAIEDQKKQINAHQEVLVAGILGVPEGYQFGDEITYRNDPTDPQFVYDFGIGPGCESQLVIPGLEAFQPKAVPPVRQKDFVEHFVVPNPDPALETNVFSVCSEDYAVALRAIARMIEDQIRPACMRACVADMDPTTTELEPSCVLEQEAPTDSGVERSTIPECEDDDGTMPDGADACYVMLTGDNMADECIDEGWNLEFQLFRAVPAPGGTSVSATCELSAQPRVDCPNL